MKRDAVYCDEQHMLTRFAKSQLSQHLKVLRDAGLIQVEIVVPRIKYCLNQDSWKKAQ